MARPSYLHSGRYSTNEGETWKAFTFCTQPVFVYGLLTEPGEKSTVFTIFGSKKENVHSWLVLQVNATDALGKRLSPHPVLEILAGQSTSSDARYLGAFVIHSLSEMGTFRLSG